MKDMGIESERVRLEWISAAEGDKVKSVINEMTEQLIELGTLGIPEKFKEWDKEVIELAQEMKAKEAGACCCGAVPAEKKEVAHA